MTRQTINPYTDMINIIISKSFKLDRNITFDTKIKYDLLQYEIYSEFWTTS